jgi:hypothetical protein
MVMTSITELGCPVENGKPACVAFCGGGWPGTKIGHVQMLRALERGAVVIDKLACGTLQEQARTYLEEGA